MLCIVCNISTTVQAVYMTSLNNIAVRTTDWSFCTQTAATGAKQAPNGNGIYLFAGTRCQLAMYTHISVENAQQAEQQSSLVYHMLVAAKHNIHKWILPSKATEPIALCSAF